MQDSQNYQLMDQKTMMTSQIVNLVSFILAMIINAIAPFISAKSLSQITAETNVRIQPAGYAFSIWGIIYTLIAIHAVYQALPQKWVQSSSCLGTRNDQMQYQDLKVLFPLNMLLNAVWLPVFGTGCSIGFFFGTIIIIAMLTTCVMIMQISLKRSLNVWEIIGLRIGFSLYSGWVTAATILNVTIFLKSVGMEEPEYNEQLYGMVILYIAEMVYLIVTVREDNPLYGLVYIWVLLAIKSKQEGYQDIQDTTLILLIIHGVLLTLYSIKMVYMKYGRKSERDGLLK